MLHLRVFGDSSAMADVAGRLRALEGVRHGSVSDGASDGSSLVTSDVAETLIVGTMALAPDVLQITAPAPASSSVEDG